MKGKVFIIFNNIKLIATDMDHTLLTEVGELPPQLNNYIYKLNKLNIDFAIASGRPLYTLTDIFSNLKNKMVFISDNGGVISYKGTIIAKSLLSTYDYHSMINFVEQETDGIPILCALNTAFLSKQNIEYDNFLKTFYSKISYVDNLNSIEEEADKFTVYFPRKNSKKYFTEVFEPKYGKKFSVTVGDTIWIDIMNLGIDKGNAMQILAEKLDITSDQMMAFGDTYNDIEMLQTVKYSYIVKNASSDMRKYANFETETNDNYGVIKILDQVVNNKLEK
ncbi:HAD family hydrolase [Liquorilactobacillus hordei]|nr:HAD family hydrolase [Liquorilactobacillus hordei]